MQAVDYSLTLQYFLFLGGSQVVRPLKVENWGRFWVLTAWCEGTEGFATFRLDLIESAEALPELFVDEPGKTLADYLP